MEHAQGNNYLSGGHDQTVVREETPADPGHSIETLRLRLRTRMRHQIQRLLRVSKVSSTKNLYSKSVLMKSLLITRDLDMEPYTVSGLARIDGETLADDMDEDGKSGVSSYHLRGMVVHSGQASGGHYYSYIKYDCRLILRLQSVVCLVEAKMVKVHNESEE
jgi:hypothetical protein